MSSSRLPRPRPSRSASHARTLPFPDLPVTPSPSRPASPRPNFSTSAPSASGSGSSTPMGRQRSGTTVAAVLGRSLPSTASLTAVAAGSSSSLGSSAPSGSGSLPSTGYVVLPQQSAPPTSTTFTPPPPSAIAPSQPQPESLKPIIPPITTPVPTSVAAPSATHSHLDDHLYRCFLQGTCADIRLRIRKWGVIYHLHRMVLVQAGFFHSLFLGGFSEANSRDPADNGVEIVDLSFDDPNITRAAFEICISRLYSTKPALHFPSSLLPTPYHPLTPHFQHRGPPPPIPTPEDPKAQLATPHLLLSIIATAIYLGQTRLLREALALTLRTIGPWTVGRYLRFAIGESIGEPEWEGQENEPARGMETLGRIVRMAPSPSPNRIDKGKGRAMSPEGCASRKASAIDPILEEAAVGSPDRDDVKCRGSLSHPSALRNRRSAELRAAKSEQLTVDLNLVGGALSPAKPKEQGLDQDETQDTTHEEDEASSLPHFYGFASNKVGEACASWLARWGLDILAYEERASKNADNETVDTDPRLHPPLQIWGHGGLPARWLRAVLAADVLFVKSEMDRYRVARRVVELRRRGWNRRCAQVQRDGLDSSQAWEEEQEEWEEEEGELEEVFATGIYYTHMAFDELSHMTEDINPATDMPFVPLHVLQAAHWSAADLRTRITQSKQATIASDAAQQELGLATTASEITKRLQRVRLGSPRLRSASANNSSFSSVRSIPGYNSASPVPRSIGRNTVPGVDPAEQIYFPIVDDETLRIGDGGFLFLSNPPAGASVDLLAGGLPDLGPDLSASVLPIGGVDPHPKPPMGESSFFGIGQAGVSAREIEEQWRELPSGSSPRKPLRWSRLEPFRFSVEFWGVDGLAEKQRAYSGTHFYAGSYFNVYVQTVRKKDKPVQLGIYLNRTSAAEPFPTPSSPEQAVVDAGTSERVIPDHPSGNDGRYKDPRDVTRAYFSISCASALGTAMIRFSSAPDSFTSSQSWGWKSVSLRTEEYLSRISPGQSSGRPREGETLDDGVLGWVGHVDPEQTKGLVSLRATVVMAVI